MEISEKKHVFSTIFLHVQVYGMCMSGVVAWTAGIPNKEQRLGIDLGYRHVIKGVATQVRQENP